MKTAIADVLATAGLKALRQPSDGRDANEQSEADRESVERVVVMILAGRDVEYHICEQECEKELAASATAMSRPVKDSASIESGLTIKRAVHHGKHGDLRSVAEHQRRRPRRNTATVTAGL